MVETNKQKKKQQFFSQRFQNEKTKKNFESSEGFVVEMC
jgi:hypothetical protein